MTKRRSTAEELAKARMARLSGMGAGGLQAMTLGLVLGGCVAVGYFVGAWLDNRFGTGFWMPTGVLVGLAAGFRETFLTVKRISALTQWPGASASSRDSNGHKPGEASDEVTGPASVDGAASKGQPAPNPPRRNRMFEVPQPPLASFEQSAQHVVQETPSPGLEKSSGEQLLRNDDLARDEEMGSETLRELLGAEKYAELQAELKTQRANIRNEETENTSSSDDLKQPQ
jgi:F0F1-type ATP synthase assembly protein I